MDDGNRTNLLDRYASGADAVDRALDGSTDADLDRRPASGGWTAREIVHHLADSEATAYIRLRRLIAEDMPVIAAYDEPEWARRLHYDRPVASSLGVLRAVRRASLELLQTLDADEWVRSGTHTDSGPYAVSDWLRIYAAHGHDHAGQILRARRSED
jgi:uncharacterized damage-inducible protein DinB